MPGDLGDCFMCSYRHRLLGNPVLIQNYLFNMGTGSDRPTITVSLQPNMFFLPLEGHSRSLRRGGKGTCLWQGAERLETSGERGVLSSASGMRN